LKSPSQLQHDEESTSFMFSSLDARQVVDTKPQFSSLDSRQVADSKPLDSAYWEWKVKIRPDGSRYVTRRPVRKHALKERARQLTAERAASTTEDDAASELKFGRFWSKPERKLHLESSKERKLKREERQLRLQQHGGIKENGGLKENGGFKDHGGLKENGGDWKEVTRRETTNNDDTKRLSLREEVTNSNDIVVTVMTV